MARVPAGQTGTGASSDERDRGPAPLLDPHRMNAAAAFPILKPDRMNATAAAPVPNDKKKAPWEGLEITWWTVRDSNPGPWD